MGDGFLGQADAAGGFYTFDASVILSPSTQYFFYENVPLPDLTAGGSYPGGVVYTSAGGNFLASINGTSLNFRVTGTPVGAAERGSTALLLGLSFTALLIHRTLGRRHFA